MYPDSGYKMTHAQSVCTRPFSRGEGPGDEAMCETYSYLVFLRWFVDQRGLEVYVVS